jgi:hypothetical protein
VGWLPEYPEAQSSSLRLTRPFSLRWSPWCKIYAVSAYDEAVLTELVFLQAGHRSSSTGSKRPLSEPCFVWCNSFYRVQLVNAARAIMSDSNEDRMLDGSLASAAWRVLRLRIEVKSFRYRQYLQIYWISSREQGTRGGNPAIGLGVEIRTLHHTK